jgi:16S rRNA (guanine966-N2)-methyltransferase
MPAPQLPKSRPKNRATHSAKPPTQAPGKVRIIGGQWKRTPLAVPQIEGLRPTPDRVRETVFNWLFTLRGGLEGARCLDLFAGSGALGFEAASRGAAQVMLVEQHAQLVSALHAVRAKLNAAQIEVRQGDALAIVRDLARRMPQQFDVVFLDPPYAARSLPATLAAIAPLLAPQAYVYAENHAPLAFEGWHAVRQDKAGAVHYGLMQALNP